MHNNPGNLIAAVSKAMGRDLDKNVFNDRLMMQNGCYILNSWGYGPKYRYALYIRGPYSLELADDYNKMVDIDGSTDVPVDSIDRLSNIVNIGVGYTEAYATVLLVKNNNPDRSIEEITKKAKDIKPHPKSPDFELHQF